MRVSYILPALFLLASAAAFAESSERVGDGANRTMQAVLALDASGHVDAAQILRKIQDDGGAASCVQECNDNASWRTLSECGRYDWGSGSADACEMGIEIERGMCESACYEATQEPVYPYPPTHPGTGPTPADPKNT